MYHSTSPPPPGFLTYLPGGKRRAIRVDAPTATTSGTSLWVGGGSRSRGLRIGLGLRHWHQALAARPHLPHWPPNAGQHGGHGGREKDEDPIKRAN
jgi:hypothetical protein